MKLSSLLTLALALSLGCGSKSADTEAKAPEAPIELAPAEPAPPEPTPEEKKKAEALKKLEEDRAKLKADHEAELARWTPEYKAEAKAVASKAYPNAKAALKATTAGKYRKAEHSERDQYRHPVETLDFFGLKPAASVLEYGPGEGWYTEVLAPALAAKGKLFVTSGDPNGNPEDRGTFYAERIKLMLEASPELYGKVETAIVDGKTPELKFDKKLDLVLVMRGMHGMVNGGTLDAWLSQIHGALKPKGVLGVEQHRAKADAVAEESSKQGYLPEAWVIQKVEAAGFKLAGKSEINANPKDSKDYAKGVWTLPPNLAEGDKDREKYLAIGESDRMTLKFVKK
jgi:predicted methyltransferase